MQPDRRAPDPTAAQTQSELLREALLARADAEAAEVRANAAREEAERAREEAERAREEAERAREEAELGRARLTVLTEAGRQMAQSIDWESTLQAVVRSAVPAVADWTALTMLEPTGALRILAVAHRDPGREELARQLIARHPPDPEQATGAANVIRSGELEIVEDLPPEAIRAAAEDPEHLRLLENLNVRHYVIAPLKGPEGAVGALTFVLGDSGRRFEPSDIELITTLAARAALHIQNSKLYTERSRIAEMLQMGLRPRPLPLIPGVEIAARFRPAGDATAVGGDFYDVLPAGDGTWAFVIGDVSGKGAQAAAVTALTRHTLTTASLLGSDPAAALALLNRAMVADSARHFCTVICARLRPGAGGLHGRFANGGHVPPLLLRRDGSVEEIATGTGPLVGSFTDASYQEAPLRLAPEDLLLMYTDGITEVSRDDATRGERELRATLAACVGRSAEEVVDAVERRAVDLLAGRTRDDMALLAIKAKPAQVEENHTHG
ncbi:MAG TPA: GAF domain-containing SpoIIE family protein phosphatase [Solirubrobacteraceae bacterium]|nr:GAF domain-containing SpoIIE family protein phosphatase [Solirubrobacteraceae bacterium]